jgi:DNA-binding NarL/FixJ family response regulator
VIGTRVAIVHPSELVTVGLAGQLRERDLAVETPERIAPWVLEHGPKVLLHARDSRADIEAVDHLISTGRELQVVALLDNDEADSMRRAVRAGCVGAVTVKAPVDYILRVVESAVRGETLLPARVAHLIATTVNVDPPDTLWLSPTERRALQMLAEGSKTNEIADAAGYSERETFRILGDLYLKMGVGNRSQAIAMAAKWGLLGD